MDECKQAETPVVDSKIIKQLRGLLEEIEMLHMDIADLKSTLSPVTKLSDVVSGNSEPKAQASTAVGEVIASLEDKIKSASIKLRALNSLLEV